MEQSSAAAIATIAPEHVARVMTASFGAERVEHTIGAPYRVGGEEARVVAYPREIAELSELLKCAQAEGWRIVPAGAGTWLEMGNAVTQFHLIVSTARMARVLEYEPADLTCALEAGVPLRAFNQQAAEHKQFIPLDPFGDERATVGATIATASAGPLRCAYGTPRDWLIGARVVHVDGTLTSAGGKVVKNVAGYDLCKLYAGSFGTLAVLAELNFKMRALPQAEQTRVFVADDAETLCKLAARFYDSDLQPAALEFLSPQTGSPVDGPRFALALRCWNEEAETVAWQLQEATRLAAGVAHTTLSEAGAAAFWRDYHASETDTRWVYSLRASGLPAELHALVADAQRLFPAGVLRAHAGNGVLRIHGGDDLLNALRDRFRPKLILEWRAATQARGGQAVILRAPEELKNQLDVWGDPGPTLALLRGLKAQYDPQARLNWGRFVAGM